MKTNSDTISTTDNLVCLASWTSFKSKFSVILNTNYHHQTTLSNQIESHMLNKMFGIVYQKIVHKQRRHDILQKF